ncbi:G2 M phase-specific E3 ubiquitin- ligase-like protein [Labeo rohita]|nr:G2 M phase-specific E3 ubiquitin- ligase-like protein [Labeo rohita]
MQECFTCKNNIMLTHLAEHIATCKCPNGNENSDEWKDSVTQPEDGSSSSDDEAVLMAVELSLQNRMVDEHQQNDMSPSQPTTEICHGEESEPDLETILRRLENQLDAGPPPFSNYINVMRDTVLSSAMRAFSRQNFSPEKRLNVVFVDTENTGEGAVDDGGPTREFFRLMIAELKNSRYFCGPEEVKNLALVSRAVQAGDYRVIGQMLAVSVIHAGITPSFFSERLYSLISHCPTPPADIEEIEDWEVRQMLQKIKNAETLEGAQDAMIEASGILALLGCSTNLRSLHDRDSLVEEAARAYVEGRVKEATEQLTEGLKTLGLADAIKAHPQMLKPLFISGSKPLDVDDILKLFRVNFSCPGSNRRRVENQTVMFWRDWLIEVGESSRPVTLQQILIFASGADKIPPLGFPCKPTIQFLHPEDYGMRIFPEANTCDITLRLPLHASYLQFREKMESGILQSPTFGFA